MNEVIHNRGIPGRDSVIGNEAVLKRMRSEGTEGDSEEHNDGGDTDAGRVHGRR